MFTGQLTDDVVWLWLASVYAYS